MCASQRPGGALQRVNPLQTLKISLDFVQK